MKKCTVLLLILLLLSCISIASIASPSNTTRGAVPTLSASDVTPYVGTDTTLFTFQVEYKDADNDTAATGYPRVNIYTDSAGTIFYKDGRYTMNEVDPGDVNYANGKNYSLTFSYDETDFLSEPTDFSYRYEIKSTGETDIIASTLAYGPVVDWIEPDYYDNTIRQDIWYTADQVQCSINITDAKGTGIDTDIIEYRYARSTDNLSRWFTLQSPITSAQDVFVSRPETFHEGDLNFYQWSCYDVAGNGPILSEVYRIKVDKTEITFKSTNPASGGTVEEEQVNFQVTITDTDTYNINNDINVSGVDLSSVQYRLRYPNEPWGQWDSTGIQEASKTQADLTAEVFITDLKPGNNYIQFRGRDLAGNGETYSDEYLIVRKNRIPEAPGWLKPSETSDPTPRITWGPGYDADGNELSYLIQIGIQVQKDYVFSWKSVGSDTYYDVEDTLKRYVTYLVQVKCYDGMDYSKAIEIYMNITGSGTNVPPLPPTNFTTAYTGVNPYVTWNEAYDPDSPDMTYYIRMGTAPGKGDIFGWKHVPLGCSYQLPMGLNITEGIFHIEVQAFDGESYSESAFTYLKVVYFEFHIEDFALNLTPGYDVEHSVKFLNKAVLSDNITIKMNGTLFSVGKIFFYGEEYIPGEGLNYTFEAAELKEIPVRFEVPKDVPVGNYTFNIYVYSENGELSGTLEKDYADIKPPKEGPPKREKTWDELCSSYWFVVALAAIALAVCLNMGYYLYKKRKGEWAEEKKEDDEYEPPPEEEEEEDLGEDEPPPTPDDEAMAVEAITEEDMSDLDDLLEPPPDLLNPKGILDETGEQAPQLGMELPEPVAVLPEDTTAEPGTPVGGLSLPPATHEEEGVEVPKIDAVCTTCGEIQSVEVTQDPRTLPCPQCGEEGTLNF